jgi:hypothetical protein
MRQEDFCRAPGWNCVQQTAAEDCPPSKTLARRFGAREVAKVPTAFAPAFRNQRFSNIPIFLEGVYD